MGRGKTAVPEPACRSRPPGLPYLELSLQSPEEVLCPILVQQPKAHIGHTLYWLAIDVPVAAGTGERVGQRRGWGDDPAGGDGAWD